MSGDEKLIYFSRANRDILQQQSLELDRAEEQRVQKILDVLQTAEQVTAFCFVLQQQVNNSCAFLATFELDLAQLQMQALGLIPIPPDRTDENQPGTEGGIELYNRLITQRKRVQQLAEAIPIIQSHLLSDGRKLISTGAKAYLDTAVAEIQKAQTSITNGDKNLSWAKKLQTAKNKLSKLK